jgi:hypothetical protein
MQVQCCATPLDVDCGLSTPALSEILRHTYRFVSDFGRKTCQLGFSLGGCIRYSSVACASAGAPACNAEAETVVGLSEALSTEHLSVSYRRRVRSRSRAMRHIVGLSIDSHVALRIRLSLRCELRPRIAGVAIDCLELHCGSSDLLASAWMPSNQSSSTVGNWICKTENQGMWHHIS